MVAVIHQRKSFGNALHYNEHKLKVVIDAQKQIYAAEFIHASGFVKDTERLGFSDKLGTLVKRAELNRDIKVNCLHISLNFDPSEKDIPEEKFRAITDAYMQKIGFAGQPYLVYKHNDAGHPHLHILTTNVKADGDYIHLHNIGRDVSEPARKAIEKEFSLVEAEAHHLKEAYQLKPVNVQKVQYGKAETKRSITNILDHVIPVYKYTSLAELNAVLQQYGVMADRGEKEGRIYKTNGLTYRLLDHRGQKMGKPIKASSIYNKPTLPFLEKKFRKNKPLRQRHKQRVKNALALALALTKNTLTTLQDFEKALQKEKIQPVFRINADGILYGATYIDQLNKTVFNGSDIDKAYSAGAIRQRFNLPAPAQRPRQLKQTGEKHAVHQQENDTIQPLKRAQQIPALQPMQAVPSAAGDALKNAIQQIMEPEMQRQSGSSLDDERRKRKRKRLKI